MIIVQVPIKHIIKYGSLKILWKDQSVPMYKWLYDNVPGQTAYNKLGPNKRNWLILDHTNSYINIGFNNAPPEVILMFKLVWGCYEDSN